MIAGEVSRADVERHSKRARYPVRLGTIGTSDAGKDALKLTPLSGYVGYALRRAQSVIFADFNHTLAGLNLRPGQFAVLVLIDQNPGTSQSSVSAALGIQKANFVATIADLEARELVCRRKSNSDARTYSLSLTAQGRALLLHAAQLQALHESRVIEQIGPEGRLQLLALLERLSHLPCHPQSNVRPGDTDVDELGSP